MDATGNVDAVESYVACCCELLGPDTLVFFFFFLFWHFISTFRWVDLPCHILARVLDYGFLSRYMLCQVLINSCCQSQKKKCDLQNLVAMDGKNTIGFSITGA